MTRSRKTSFALALLVILSTVALTCSGSWASAANLPPGTISAGKGYIFTSDGLKVMHLQGTPFEMGVQHGALLGKEANDLRRYIDPSVQEHKGMDALAWKFRQFYMDTKLSPTFIRNIPDRYIDEMRGFVSGVSDGAETSIEPALMANVFQELSIVMCTSVAAWGEASEGGRLYQARNLDYSLPLEMTKSGLAVIYEPEGRWPFVTLTYPANVGLMHGMNSQGITVSMSYSLTTDTSLDGIPFMFLLRRVLEEAATLDQALAIVKEAPRTIGLNIMIGDAKIPRSVVVEVSANHYRVRESDSNFISATNRYASEEMQSYQTPGWYSSALRDKRLGELGEQLRGKINPQAMADILRDKLEPGTVGHAGFVPAMDSKSTITSLIFDPENLVMWAAVMDEDGPAPDHTLRAVSLQAALEGGNPRRSDLDIPVANPTDPYLQDWMHVYQADQALSKGDLVAAESLLLPLLQRHPQAEMPLYLLSKVYTFKGDTDKAIDYLQRFVTLPEITEPRHLQEATVYLGAMLDRKGRREEALSWYKRSLSVEVPDIGGESESLRKSAEKGLRQPLGRKEPILTSLLRARVFTAGPPVEGTKVLGTVGKISVLGAHRTDPDWIPRWLGVAEGDSITSADLAAMTAALNSLGAFSSAKVAANSMADGRVALVIRVEEGFGFYHDPVEFIATTAMDLANNTLSLRYDNLLGRAVNVAGSYSWGGSKLRKGLVQWPVRFGGPAQAELQVESRTAGMQVKWGSLAGTTVNWQRKSARVGISKVLTPAWRWNLNGQVLEDTITSVQGPAEGVKGGRLAYVSGAVIRTSGDWRKGSAASLGGGVMVKEEASSKGGVVPRASAHVAGWRPITINMQAAVSLDAAWTPEIAPLIYHYRLGGSSLLRGYGSGIVTSRYIHASPELRRYLTSDLHVALFTDAALVELDQEGSKLVWTPGLTAEYKTPVGPSVSAMVAYGPETEAWRFNIGVQLP